MATITYDEAVAAFEYRNGGLFWRPWVTKKGKLAACSGKRAGYMSHDGYWKVGYKRRAYYVHQIIFLMHHGYIPAIVDHADHNTKNNSIENLRAADKAQNSRNSKLRADNSSGVKGVTWSKAAEKWQACIQVDNKSVYLGLFTSLEDAAASISIKRSELHGEFARAE
jgi:hypothetical protein